MKFKHTKWLKGVGAVIAAFVGVVSGSLSIAKDLGWETSGFWLLVANNSFWIVPAACLIVGIIGGWSLHASMTDIEVLKAAAVEKAKQDGETERLRLEQERIEEERKAHEQEERERAEAERIRKQQKLEQSRIDLVKHLPFHAKDSMWTLYQKGSIILGGTNNCRFFADLGFATWVDYETVGYGEERWFLKDWAKEFLDAHPELLDCARQAQKQREAVDDSITENGHQATMRAAGELYGFDE